MDDKKRSIPWEDLTDREVAQRYYRIATKGRGRLFRLYTWLAVVLPEYVEELGRWLRGEKDEGRDRRRG